MPHSPPEERHWFNDPFYREELESKIASNNFFIQFPGGVGVVKKVIYAGFKVALPNGKEITVNLSDHNTYEISESEFLAEEKDWEEKISKQLEQQEQIRIEKATLLQLQKDCTHDVTQQSCVKRAAGCDIDDTVCINCCKILLRSWSTGYDNDPKSHVSDWDWWAREYNRRYCDVNREHSSPNKIDYEIVDNIEPI